MSIPGPLDLNTQLVTSSFTGETNPHNIILKNTMWVVFTRNNNIRIREYKGIRIDPDIITSNIDQFTISNSLDNFGIISLNKFLLWTVEDGKLYVTEIEPFIEKEPIIGTKTLFLNDVNVVKVNVFKNNEINIILLDTDADFGQKLSFKIYPALNLPSNFNKILDWGNGNFDTTREFDNIGMFKDINNNELLISYSKSGSPLNINLDEYTFIILPVNTNISGSAKISAIVTIEPIILPFVSKTPDAEKDLFLKECAGSPGVKIKIIDNSKIDLSNIPNSVAGIVGFSSNGPFNRIIRISSTSQIDKILGNGFNNSEFNQGLYASRAILNNGGFVEFVRPYGETIDPLSLTDRELKSDAYVFKYNYNTLSKNNIDIDFFSATRHSIDGYKDISLGNFGNREIFTAQKAILEGKNFDFTLDKNEISSVGVNEIALFSIINEDPTTSISAESENDTSADKLIVSFAGYKIARRVTDSIQFTSLPSIGDKFSTIDENGIVRQFVFVSTITTGLNIQIGTSTSTTLDNIKLALTNNMVNHTFTKINNKILGSVYFGTKDQYNEFTQNIIFSVIIGSAFTTGISIVDEDAYIIDSSIGRRFLELGLADETYAKESFNGNLLKKYILNNDGKMVAKLYLMVDYIYGGTVYSFSGTIIPYTYNAIDLYIKREADSVSNNFQFIVNNNTDLVTATTNINFNLANVKNTIEVKVTSSSNIVLSGIPVNIDGITSFSSGDMILVNGQTNKIQNGVYTISSGVWVRSQGANKNSDFNTDMFIYVNSGIIYINTYWKVSTQYSDVMLESTQIRFYQDSNQQPLGFITKVAFDENDPAYINSAEWQYVPSSQLSSETMSAAWELFLDKEKSQADFLVASGTCIKNLFYKNKEELDYNVISAMLRICELRKDMFAIFDGVDELNIDIALQKMIGVGSFGDRGRWGAIFDGRSIFNDKSYTKLEVRAVKSIEVGAIITNNRRGGIYWIPPAGKDFGTIPQALANRQTYIRRFNSADDTSSDVSKLYSACINPTRLLKSTPVIYGQRTMLKKDNDLNRLNVTMLIAGLHKRLSNFLDNKMLKLNTYSLRLSVREELTNILNKIKSANPPGLTSFEVRCDDSNNTKETICQNKLIIDIYLNPTKSAECIILRTTIQRTEKELILSDFQLKIQ